MPNIQFRCTCCVHTWMSLDFFGVIFFSFFFAFFLFNSTGSALSISPDVLLLQSSSGMSKKDWRVSGLTRRDVFCFCVLLFFSPKKKYGYSRSPSGLQPTRLCSLSCFSSWFEITKVCVKLLYITLLQIEVNDGTSCT